MSEVKWIKIVTDIFDDEKILLIESLPSGDSLIVIWFKLLCLAGKNNNNGVFLLNDRIPYTEEMLASIFRRDINTVRFALKTFADFGMIEIVEGVITIPNWDKHQTLDAYEKKKVRDREYQAERRAKQKSIIQKSSDKSSDKSLEKSSDVVVSDIDIDKDKDIDIDKEKDINYLSNTKVFDCPSLQDEPEQKYVYQKYVDMWNTLQPYGISKCQRIPAGNPNAAMLRKRLKEYGEESFEKIIEEIKNSDFLQGKIASYGKTPFNLTFGWAIKPTNYRNILEGKYRNRTTERTIKSGFDTFDIGG